MARGFTTIELVMVIVMIGILSVVAWANWPTDSGVYAETEQFVMALREAQTGAIEKDPGYSLAWTGANSIEVRDDSGAAITVESYDYVTMANFGTITFDQYGEPDNPGTITMNGPSGFSLVVDITTQTGYARIQ